MGLEIKFYDVRDFTTKYLIAKDFNVDTPIRPESSVVTRYVCLTDAGKLTVRKGMPTDGPSGPTIDTPAVMGPAFVHDAFYYLLRLGAIPQELRKPIDQLFHRMLLDNGVGRFRARYFYWAVRAFGGKYARKRGKPVVKTARQSL